VKELSAAELDALIEEAAVDAYTEDGELTGAVQPAYAGAGDGSCQNVPRSELHHQHRA